MIYLDTSVLVSLHIRDVNSAAARSLVIGAGDTLAVSSLSEFETLNAFSLRVFRNEMLPVHRDTAARDFDEDIKTGVLTLMPLSEACFTRAKTLAHTLTPNIGVRAVDLLHVAATMELGASALFTFDRKQHRTAQAAGLAVNPLP
jgi:predicted nucleic acid-binding protein